VVLVLALICDYRDLLAKPIVCGVVHAHFLYHLQHVREVSHAIVHRASRVIGDKCLCRPVNFLLDPRANCVDEIARPDLDADDTHSTQDSVAGDVVKRIAAPVTASGGADYDGVRGGGHLDVGRFEGSLAIFGA
jgi:hypothetical protein